jgi:DNA polymerase elongation subunit (family B)
MGIEIKKATVPKYCRDKMEEAVKLMMETGDNERLIDFIDITRKEFNSLPPEKVASPRGVNGLGKYAEKENGVPLHVKGALCYNSLIAKHGLAQKYPEIQEGEKIKFVYLKVPNPTRDKVIAFVQKLPSEFNLDKYIDYQLQFQKTFIDPLNAILTVIGWEHERRATLMAFF